MLPEDLPAGFAGNLLALKQEIWKRRSATAEARRAGARGVSRGDPGPAECREIVAAECARAARRGDRHGGAGNDPGRAGGAAWIIGGYAVVIQDTAGLREAASLAEGEGVRRAEVAAEAADLVLWLSDCREPD